ncbi:hypothetical protein AURDEDRAFT_162393 [Auricularia subglabra TFB-10046 SS5]|nr:hypothetical protein AURDEDRAFT_162393 [Auricularia subglabra TFB-10046 SS5]
MSLYYVYARVWMVSPDDGVSHLCEVTMACYRPRMHSNPLRPGAVDVGLPLAPSPPTSPILLPSQAAPVSRPASPLPPLFALPGTVPLEALVFPDTIPLLAMSSSAPGSTSSHAHAHAHAPALPSALGSMSFAHANALPSALGPASSAHTHALPSASGPSSSFAHAHALPSAPAFVASSTAASNATSVSVLTPSSMPAPGPASMPTSTNDDATDGGNEYPEVLVIVICELHQRPRAI